MMYQTVLIENITTENVTEKINIFLKCPRFVTIQAEIP